MSLNDLGNVKGPQGPTGATGPQGPTGATGATGPQGPAGPDLHVETDTLTKTVSASYSQGGIAYDIATIPNVSGYTPILAIGESDKWDVVFVPRKFNGTQMFYNLFTVKETVETAATVTVKVYYQKT